MKRISSRWLGVVYILATILAVIVIGVVNHDFLDALRAIRTLDPYWLLAALGCIFGYVFTRALALYTFVRRQHVAIRMGTAINCALQGLYYSGITPAATGGQPMQVYYLKKHDVPVSVGTSAVAVKFVCYQMMLLVLCVVFWLCNRGVMTAHMGSTRWILLVGFLVNAGMMACTFMVMFQTKLLQRIMQFGIRVGTRLRLIRNPEDAAARAQTSLDAFEERMSALRSHPNDAGILLVITTFQHLCYMSTIYCLYRAFGLSELQWGEVVTLQLLLFVTASFIPTPGASGAQEGGFFLFFRGVFSEASILGALMAWRFFTYYLVLLMGLASVVATGIRSIQTHPKTD